MKEQQQHIHKKNIFRYSSSKKYLKVFVPDFAFKHDNDDESGKDKFVGRDVQFRRLYTWLTSDSKSGSYLITGYRGMGKSLLVKRVIEVITREPRAYKEAVFFIVLALIFCAGCWGFGFYEREKGSLMPSVIMGCVAFGLVVGLCFSKKFNFLLFEKERRKLKNHSLFDKEFVSKFFIKRKDRREREFGIEHGHGMELFDKFIEIYNATMDKDHAEEYYYFKRPFYESIHNDLRNNYEMFYAKLEDKIIAMSIMIFANGRMNYHLSGSDIEYRHLAPSNLLLYKAALWGCEQGFKTFHLGGGVGSDEDNLYKFKTVFNKNSDYQFSIGKQIFDQEKYDELVKFRWESDPNFEEASHFFPLYRA